MSLNIPLPATAALATDIYFIGLAIRPGDQAWVPDGQNQLRTYMGAGEELNKQWALKKDSQRPGYFTFHNIGAAKFAHIEDGTGNIVVGDEVDATSFYVDFSRPTKLILQDANHNVGWSISSSSDVVVLGNLKDVGSAFGQWNFHPLLQL